MKFKSSDAKVFCKKGVTPALVFSCEFCEFFKNSFFFKEHLRWLLLEIVSFKDTGFIAASVIRLLLSSLDNFMCFHTYFMGCTFKSVHAAGSLSVLPENIRRYRERPVAWNGLSIRQKSTKFLKYFNCNAYTSFQV